MQAVEHVKAMANVEPYNLIRLNASEISESEIWACLEQHPIDVESPRLVIVTEAQRLQQLDRLIGWLKSNQGRRVRSATAVFVSNDDDVLEIEAHEVLKKSSNATVVRCVLPKNPEDRLKRAQEVLCSWGDIDPITAGVLIKRVNYDMIEARAVMQKAALFPDFRINVRAVELLAPRRVEDDLINSLLGMNKKGAVEAAMEAGADNIGNIIGSLGTAVESLGRINTKMTAQSNVRELSQKTRMNEQYIRRLLPHARFYSRKECVRRTLLLNQIETAYQAGAREGVLEALIASW